MQLGKKLKGSFTGLKDLRQFYVNTWFPHTLPFTPPLLTSFPLLHSSTPPLLHSSLPFLSISLSPSSCALASLFHHFLASILHSPTPSTLASFPGLSCFFFFFFLSLVCIQYDIWKRKSSKALSLFFLFHCYTEHKLKNKKQGRPGNEATTPFTPPTFIIHPMPSLSTSPAALLDNEVTAVSTIWRAQPDNKTVSDRRSCRTQDPRPFERRS